jgi:GTP cyclohydrolase II
MTMSTTNVSRRVTARIPTGAGEFQLYLYTNNQDDKEHLAFVFGDVEGCENVLVRVHSECFTGDVMGSRRCDCGEQLKQAMQQIALEGQGVLVYLRQEGRGIGLLDKLRAYNLQDLGYDTVEANLLLGHQADEREYSIAARILEDLKVCSIRLLTNNPSKINHLRDLGVTVVERVQLDPSVNAENLAYLLTKVQRMDHMFNLGPIPIQIHLPAAHNGSH